MPRRTDCSRCRQRCRAPVMVVRAWVFRRGRFTTQPGAANAARATVNLLSSTPWGKLISPPASKSANGIPRASASACSPQALAVASGENIPLGESPYATEKPRALRAPATAANTAGCVVTPFSAAAGLRRLGLRRRCPLPRGSGSARLLRPAFSRSLRRGQAQLSMWRSLPQTLGASSRINSTSPRLS